jgi:hypothetical protein
MKQPWRALGWLWASPLTLLGFLYVTVFSFFGWYLSLGLMGDALVWRLRPDVAPSWLKAAWRHWAGHAIGNVVVLNSGTDTVHGQLCLRHEQEHVHQCMVLGPLLPVFYFTAYLGLKFCSHAHPYYDNPFEIDARRAAGQVIDVIGTLKRAYAEGKIKLPKKRS